MGDRLMRAWVARLMALGISCLGEGLAAQEATTAAPPADGQPARQIVDHYMISFEPVQNGSPNPWCYYDHMGGDRGRMGPAGGQLLWEDGVIEAGTPQKPLVNWAGMWHSLCGLVGEHDRTVDFGAMYPEGIVSTYQPKCTGLFIRVRGRGELKLELKAPDGDPRRVVWEQRVRLDLPNWEELPFTLDPARLQGVKMVNWVAEPGAAIEVDSIGLALEVPSMADSERAFLYSYVKLLSCFDPQSGFSRDRANWPSGDFDALPPTGMVCLATAAAWDMGVVEKGFASAMLERVHQAVRALPRAYGLLPHFVRLPRLRYTGKGDPNGQRRIHPKTEYSTLDTTLYYYSMILAAQVLDQQQILAELLEDVRAIEFGELRDEEGFILHGVADDAKTKLAYPDGQGRLRLSCWRDWGGETALVLMLGRIAEGETAPLKMDPAGEVHNGTGFIAEVASLFLPCFNGEFMDVVTNQNWLAVRRKLLEEQMAFSAGTTTGQPGLYGLSAGEGRRGIGYCVNGTVRQQDPDLLHPHYVLMSAQLREPAQVCATLRQLEHAELFSPMGGLVENVSASDPTQYLPMRGGLNAGFEALGAYHLHAKRLRAEASKPENAAPDVIYKAALACEPVAEAMRGFYTEGQLREIGPHTARDHGPMPGNSVAAPIAGFQNHPRGSQTSANHNSSLMTLPAAEAAVLSPRM